MKFPKIKGHKKGYKAPKDRLNKAVEFKPYHMGDEFPTDFWNYRLNPISGLPPAEVALVKRAEFNPRLGIIFKHKH